MRNTQLDSSMPQPRQSRGQGALPAGEEVTISYLPPIVATLGSAIFLVVLFGVLTYVSVSILVNLVSDPTQDVAGSLALLGGCGIGSLLLLVITLYFVNAARIAARDLGAKPVHFEGSVVQHHHGRGRGSGYWVVIRPAGAAATASIESLAVGSDPVETSAFPARGRGFVTGGFGSFGSQLQDVGVAPRSPETEKDEPLPPPPSRRKLQPGEVNLRVDKPTYQELAAGDRVEAVYSPHLQHVYYIRKQTASGEPIILRNLALI
ncbi:MAG: hypothetical protein ACR2M0_06555 [Chloroflexia bacterium]